MYSENGSYGIMHKVVIPTNRTTSCLQSNSIEKIPWTFRQFQSSYHIHIRYIFADALFSAHRNSAELQQRDSRECNSPTRRLRDKNVSNQGRVLLSELFPSNDLVPGRREASRGQFPLTVSHSSNELENRLPLVRYRRTLLYDQPSRDYVAVLSFWFTVPTADPPCVRLRYLIFDHSYVWCTYSNQDEGEKRRSRYGWM